MYYIGKILQACALAIILIGFVRNFPELMDHRSLVIGVLMFVCGWFVDRFLLKR